MGGNTDAGEKEVGEVVRHTTKDKLIKMSDFAISKIKTPTKTTEYWDKQTPAFGLRVFASGRKSFTVMLRFSDKKLRRFTIGQYPRVSVQQAKAMMVKIFEAKSTEYVNEGLSRCTPALKK